MWLIAGGVSEAVEGSSGGAAASGLVLSGILQAVMGLMILGAYIWALWAESRVRTVMENIFSIPELLKKAGCKGLLVGFESTNAASLVDCGKRQNDPKAYLELVHRLADHGIGIVGSFVLGLDSDTPDTFEQILEFSVAAKFFMATFCTLTPYPGTPLYDRLLKEDRLLTPRWWLEPLTDFPLHRPMKMTPEQLYEGDMWLWKEFYTHSSIWKRYPHHARMSLFAFLAHIPFNYFQRYLANTKLKEGREYFASQAT